MYADEAYNSQPKFRFHHFYGGALILENLIPLVEKNLLSAIPSGFRREMKWQNVDSLHKNVYLEFLKVLFDELALGHLKLRVLYLDRHLESRSAWQLSRQEQYFKLYYMFLTRAFGWSHAPLSKEDVISLRIHLDQLTDQSQQKRAFLQFLRDIPVTARFRGIQMRIGEGDIAEIDSRKHVVAQAVDMVIGALGYKLNRLNEVVQENGRRGKRTRSKEAVYKYMQTRLSDLGLKNIGITTGLGGNPQRMWSDPIRIWSLRPQDLKLNPIWIKKAPPSPTDRSR